MLEQTNIPDDTKQIVQQVLDSRQEKG